MIFPNPYQMQAAICMQMTPIFSTNMGTTKKIEVVLIKEFSSLCQWFIDNKPSIHFGEDKTKSILFSKVYEKLTYPLHPILLTNTKQ